MSYCLNRLMLVILFMIISLTGTVDAGWWNAGWQYRKGISINNAGGELSDNQVPIMLNASNFDYARAAVGGADLRFTDSGGSELNSRFEKRDYANRSGLSRTGGKEVMMI